MVAFGLLMVYSASYIYAQEKTGDGYFFIKKQLAMGAVGIALCLSVCRIDYRRWMGWAYPFLGVAIVLLALTLIPGIGTRVGGAKRWIRLGAMNFQPGELAKFAVIFFVAGQLYRKAGRLDRLAAGVLGNFLVPLPALLILLAQPDFGTTVIITGVVLALMYLAGVPKKYLLSAIALAGVAAAGLVLGSSYRRARLMSFFDPWSDPGGRGFQILQSLTGLHHGGWFGAGLGNSKEKLFYLPEAHNDFILSVIGEELGFVGIVGVIAAYVTLVIRGFRIAARSWELYQDRFGMLLASGITLALGLQGLVNIAVVLGMVPTKGLTLPFISYGGSALLIDLFAIGVLLSVARGPVAAAVRGHRGG